ncbi:hypothetical protein OG304_06815 [Streptomyces sp. NBC_00160]|uniref:hypothetical protein n=1 Tax=Streptomyces sp. NBC_00160 TaxID=2903628 RepID=UPI00224CA345|nr:hypothetical protein [Streptomyces sp. NBC_00160]MCX5303164.1 hypothetical protein [Streptomyces sp. NBC_00160]
MPPDEAHQHALRRLGVFLREAEDTLASWDAYSDRHTAPDGWPHDDTAYGLRQRRRDADTWRAFTTVRAGAAAMLDTAEAQLSRLPAGSTSLRRGWHLKVLRTGLKEINALQSEWLGIRDTLPVSARPGTEEYDEPLAERNAEAWAYLDTWALHGQSVLDIDAAARAKPSRKPVISALAPTLPSKAGSTSWARR